MSSKLSPQTSHTNLDGSFSASMRSTSPSKASPTSFRKTRSQGQLLSPQVTFAAADRAPSPAHVVSPDASEAGDDTASQSSFAGRRKSSGGDNVKVVCRVRPFNKREMDLQEESNAQFQYEYDKQPLRSVVEMESQSTIFLDHEKDWVERQRFPFDINLWSVPADQQPSSREVAGQETVMSLIGEPALHNIWVGFNTCVFAYGQTGSGKTYTMMGTEEQRGLIPRMCSHLFDELQRKRQEDGGVVIDGMVKEYHLEARFLEIYNERIRDLLWALRTTSAGEDANLDANNLKIRFVPRQGPFVVGLTCVKVEDADACLRLIEEGTRNRSVAATKMNDQSSRSHSIFRLTLTQTTKVLPKKQYDKPKLLNRTSIVSLIDLAGSERNKKTGAEGQRLREAVAINQSLMSLKNVIDALVDGRSVVPYRDSNLTWLLSDSLGGNSKTFMIACVSPHLDNAEETLNTLRYAIRAQQIVNTAQVNESEELRRMNRIREEMERIQRQIQHDPEEREDLLLKQAENLHLALRAMEVEQEKQRRETTFVGLVLSRAAHMQFTAVYKNVVSRLWSNRLDDMFSAQFREYTHRQTIAQVDVESLKRDLTELEADLSSLKVESTIAKGQHAKAVAELRVVSFRGESLEKARNSLLAEEHEFSSVVRSKIPLNRWATWVTSMMVVWQRRKIEDDRTRGIEQRARATEEVMAQQQREDSAARAYREERLRQASQRKAEAERRVKNTHTFLSTRLHALRDEKSRKNEECVFNENESKRVAATFDSQLFEIHKVKTAKLAAAEDDWASRIEQLQTDSKIRLERCLEAIHSRLGSAESEFAAEKYQLESAAKAAIDDCEARTDATIRRLQAERTLKRDALDALNRDSAALIRETSDSEPRFRSLYDAVLHLMRSPPSSDAAANELLAALQQHPGGASHGYGSPQKFVAVSAVPLPFRCDAFEAAPQAAGGAVGGAGAIVGARSSTPAPRVASPSVGASPAAAGSATPLVRRRDSTAESLLPASVLLQRVTPSRRFPTTSPPVTPRSASNVSLVGSLNTARESVSKFDRMHVGLAANRGSSVASLRPPTTSSHDTRSSTLRSQALAQQRRMDAARLSPRKLPLDLASVTSRITPSRGASPSVSSTVHTSRAMSPTIAATMGVVSSRKVFIGGSASAFIISRSRSPIVAARTASPSATVAPRQQPPVVQSSKR